MRGRGRLVVTQFKKRKQKKMSNIFLVTEMLVYLK